MTPIATIGNASGFRDTVMVVVRVGDVTIQMAHGVQFRLSVRDEKRFDEALERRRATVRH